MAYERWRWEKRQRHEGARRLESSFYSRSLDVGAAPTKPEGSKETVEEFLARNGKVRKLPTHGTPSSRSAIPKPGGSMFRSRNRRQ